MTRSPFLLPGLAVAPCGCRHPGSCRCAETGRAGIASHGVESRAVVASQEIETRQDGEAPVAACAVDCLDPPATDLKRIRAGGKRDGDYIDRTVGDPQVNLGLQLFDYDINAYSPTKPKHAEALGLIREFILDRSLRSPQPIAVTITGLSSRTGGSTYNDILSCKRARCAADNLQTSLAMSHVVASRVQINAAGDGFTRATCKDGECELGVWRAVLIQVHAPGAPPAPIDPIDARWGRFSMRCCSFHTENLAAGVLGDLLQKGLPGIPPGLRGKILDGLRDGIKSVLKRAGKEMAFILEDAETLFELFPAEIIRERGVFEIRERDKPNARAVVTCYSGVGLRLILPRENLDDFLHDALAKAFPRLLPAIRRTIEAAIVKLVPNAVKTLVQPIESNSPGPPVEFDLLHPRLIEVFEGAVQVGKGVWMPGRVNVQFASPAWGLPDKQKRPLISACPGTDCNDGGVQMVVGSGQGLELFSITAGDMLPGDCRCERSTAKHSRELAPFAATARAAWPLDAKRGHEQELPDGPTGQKVANSFAVPFCWVAKVSIYKNGRFNQHGSGVLISDRHVLTAAHVVYDVVRNPGEYDLDVRLAVNGNSWLGPYRAARAPDISGLYRTESLDQDFAIITLARPIANVADPNLKCSPLAFWGSAACGVATESVPVDVAKLDTQTAITAGYPRNQGGNALWMFSGKLGLLTEHGATMLYDGDLSEGQSGSPVWIDQGGQLNLIGIAVARGSGNRILRMSPYVDAQCNEWMLRAESASLELEYERLACESGGLREAER